MNGVVKNQLLDHTLIWKIIKPIMKEILKLAGAMKKWTINVSEFHIATRKLYLSLILDMYNHEIISYFISKIPNYEQTKEMLSYAFEKTRNINDLYFI